MAGTVRVAQLDRASASEAEGRRFDSCRERQALNIPDIAHPQKVSCLTGRIRGPLARR